MGELLLLVELVLVVEKFKSVENAVHHDHCIFARLGLATL